jgi:hypothetical protein
MQEEEALVTGEVVFRRRQSGDALRTPGKRSRRFAYLAGLREVEASFVVLRFSSKMRLISSTVSWFAKTV